MCRGLDPEARPAHGLHVVAERAPDHQQWPVCACVLVAENNCILFVCPASDRNSFGWRRFRLHTEDFLRGRSSVLTIDPVEMDDFGHYNCSVSNALGLHSALVVLERRGALTSGLEIT